MNPSLARDRLKMGMVALSIVAFLAVVAAGGAWMAAVDSKAVSERGVEEILQSQQNGNVTRALLCQTILYDNDRLDAGAPIQDEPCRWPAVVALYPPEVCVVAPSLGAPNLCTPLD